MTETSWERYFREVRAGLETEEDRLRREVERLRGIIRRAYLGETESLWDEGERLTRDLT